MDDFEITLRFQWRTPAECASAAKKLRLLADVLGGSRAIDRPPVAPQSPARKSLRSEAGDTADYRADLGDVSALEPEVRKAIIYGLTQRLSGQAGGGNTILDLLRRFEVRKLQEVAASDQAEVIELLQAALGVSAPAPKRGGRSFRQR